MEKGFFHPDRGYWQTNSEPSPEILQTYPAGTIEVPLMPDSKHEWNGARWVLRPQDQLDAMVAANVREERNFRLATEVDPMVTNPLRWGDLSAEQQQAWADYRRSLLDITAQTGFPHSVTWPVKPE